MTDQGKKFQDFLDQCFSNPELKQKLLADPAETIKAAGIAVPAGMKFKVTELDTGQLEVETLYPESDLPDEALAAVAGGLFNQNRAMINAL